MGDFSQHRVKRPFRLGTTSFIIPDYMAPNVEKLGPYFDEIELLVFESDPLELLPAKEEIRQLKLLSSEHELTYNVHLPVDVLLTGKDSMQKACDHILKVIELFRDLPVTTHTLHLEMTRQMVSALKAGHLASGQLENWQEQAQKGLCLLLAGGADPGSISVETLDYPFSLVEPIVEQLGLSVCIDAGHLIKYGEDLLQVYERHEKRLVLIHLHGVDFRHGAAKDHTGLDALPQKHLEDIYRVLAQYRGTVSLEVFNLDHLNRCLSVLSERFEPIPPRLSF